MSRRITLYDTTLRDGAQTRSVDFSVADKLALACAMDDFGIDYIEGGWPGANPNDDAFFAAPPSLKQAKLTAFGMTQRSGGQNDPGFAAILAAKTPALCIVGKSWDFHVDLALGISLPDNLRLIADSITALRDAGREALFDAEHFFDGYKANPDYALQCLKAAAEAGADWIVLCDTNGGTLPHEIAAITRAVAQEIAGEKLGIHCHNDTGHATANSLAAIQAGACMIQGTLNGLGERCGNADLVEIIPNLVLKLGYTTGVDKAKLTELTALSRLLDQRLNHQPKRERPFVGENAFAHKGGLHVSAVNRDPRSYEHIDPQSVGNQRHILVSDQAGRSNLLARLTEIGIEADPADLRLAELMAELKHREYLGYAYDGAEASFEIMARQWLDYVPDYFELLHFRVLDEWHGEKNEAAALLSEAVIKLRVGERNLMRVAEGNGPVNALDHALREALAPAYPAVKDMQLVDYRVRILPRAGETHDGSGTDAVTRVVIESCNIKGQIWTTVGVSANIIDASYRALRDAIIWHLMQAGVKSSMSEGEDCILPATRMVL